MAKAEASVDVVGMIRSTFMEFFAATALMLTINLLITFQSSVETLRLDVVRYSVLVFHLTFEWSSTGFILL